MKPACLLTLSRMADAAPVRFPRAMLKAGKMGRGGNVGAFVVVGYGIQARGTSWAEAGRLWARGAHTVANDLEASRDLVDRMS